MPTYEIGFKPSALNTTASATLVDRRTHRGTANLLSMNTTDLVRQVQVGDRVIGAGVAGRAVTNGTPATARLVIYETDSTGMTEGALVGVDTISITTSIGTIAWYTVTGLNLDLTPWAGKYIKVAILNDGGQFRRCNISGGLSGDMVSGSTGEAADPFGSAIGQTSLNPFYVVIEDGAAAISGINGGNPATYGESVEWDSTFSPNTATVDGVPASGVSASGMTLPALVDGQIAPRPGSRTVAASEGVSSANSTVVIDPPTGFQYVQLTTQVTDETRATPDEAEPGDHFMVETKNNTIAYPDGTVGTNHVGSVIAWLIKNTTKIAGQYQIIFGEEGEVISVDPYRPVGDVQFESLRALGFTGTTSDMYLQWLRANGATAYNTPDAQREFLTARGQTGLYHVNEGFYNWLGSLGHTGTLNERWKDFWTQGGDI